MSVYDTIKTSADQGFQEATIEVSFVSDQAEEALKALNAAYAEARELIESRTRPNAVAEVPQPVRPALILLDGEGDRWIRQAESDLYNCEGAALAPRTREQIAKEFGGAREVE